MRRILLVLISTVTLTVSAASVPVNALGEVQVTLSCTDGVTPTEVTLVVDAPGLLELKDAVEAIALYPAGLSCSLAEAPLVSAFSLTALAGNGPQDSAVGGGTFVDTRSDCADLLTNPTGMVHVHLNIDAHREAANTSAVAFGHFMERVVEPGNPCNGNERRATVYCLTVNGNLAEVRATHTVATGTYLPGANALAWYGQDNQPKPDFTYSAQGSSPNCPPVTAGPPLLIFPLQGNISIHDR